MATHSSMFACRIPRTEEPGGLQSMRSQRVIHDWATNTHTHSVGLGLVHLGFECQAEDFKFWNVVGNHWRRLGKAVICSGFHTIRISAQKHKWIVATLTEKNSYRAFPSLQKNPLGNTVEKIGHSCCVVSRLEGTYPVYDKTWTYPVTNLRTFFSGKKKKNFKYNLVENEFRVLKGQFNGSEKYQCLYIHKTKLFSNILKNFKKVFEI